MDIRQLKDLSKKVSKEALFDIIYNKQFSEDELLIFKTEVNERGLEAELAETIKDKEFDKAKIKEAVNKLSKEDLFNIVVYNLYKFTEKELLIFKNEVKARGFEEQLATVLNVKEADDMEFKHTVLDNSKDAIELLENFNAYTDKKNPGITTSIKGNEIKKRKTTFLSLILAATLMLIGVFLTLAGKGIFFVTILVGISLLRGIIIKTKS